MPARTSSPQDGGPLDRRAQRRAARRDAADAEREAAEARRNKRSAYEERRAKRDAEREAAEEAQVRGSRTERRGGRARRRAALPPPHAGDTGMHLKRTAPMWLVWPQEEEMRRAAEERARREEEEAAKWMSLISVEGAGEGAAGRVAECGSLRGQRPGLQL
jgi:hypothetical protein